MRFWMFVSKAFDKDEIVDKSLQAKRMPEYFLLFPVFAKVFFGETSMKFSDWSQTGFYLFRLRRIPQFFGDMQYSRWAGFIISIVSSI